MKPIKLIFLISIRLSGMTLAETPIKPIDDVEIMKLNASIGVRDEILRKYFDEKVGPRRCIIFHKRDGYSVDWIVWVVEINGKLKIGRFSPNSNPEWAVATVSPEGDKKESIEKSIKKSFELVKPPEGQTRLSVGKEGSLEYYEKLLCYYSENGIPIKSAEIYASDGKFPAVGNELLKEIEIISTSCVNLQDKDKK